MSLLVSPLDLARLSARLSFRDLPDFLVIVLRGDLSDMAVNPSVGEPERSPEHERYASDRGVHPQRVIAHARVPRRARRT